MLFRWVTVSVLSIFAIMPCFAEVKDQVSSIKKIANGNVEIIYNIVPDNREDTEGYRLIDDDGMATLATIHFLLIQEVSDQIWKDASLWDEISKQPVKNWNLAKQFEKDSLNRLIKYWTDHKEIERADKTSKLLASVSEKGFFNETVPTYFDLNLIGYYIEKNARDHSYKINFSSEALMDRSRNNPVGSALDSRSMFLSPQTVSSRNQYWFKPNWNEIVQTYNQAPTLPKKRQAPITAGDRFFGELTQKPKTIRVLNETGAIETYELSSKLNMGSISSSDIRLSVGGLSSRCPPYLGTLAEIFEVSVTTQEYEEISVSAPPSSKDKLVRVYGECEGKDKILKELSIQSQSDGAFKLK